MRQRYSRSEAQGTWPATVKDRCHDAGFTLLELLVGVVLLSIGVLSVAALQVTTTQSSFTASQNLEAAMLLETATNRMRANSERLDVYVSEDINGAVAPSLPMPGGCTAAMAEPECLTATATLDRWELQQLLYLSQSLVQAKICIAQNATNLGEVSVTVAWHGMVTRASSTTTLANDCGRDSVNPTADETLQQMVFNTYITTVNPY